MRPALHATTRRFAGAICLVALQGCASFDAKWYYVDAGAAKQAENGVRVAVLNRGERTCAIRSIGLNAESGRSADQHNSVVKWKPETLDGKETAVELLPGEVLVLSLEQFSRKDGTVPGLCLMPMEVSVEADTPCGLAGATGKVRVGLPRQLPHELPDSWLHCRVKRVVAP
jgi:hypothetical protein